MTLEERSASIDGGVFSPDPIRETESRIGVLDIVEFVNAAAPGNVRQSELGPAVRAAQPAESVSDEELLWWVHFAAQPLRESQANINVDVTALMSLAAQYSGRVLAVRQEPWIKGTQQQQAAAAFDPRLFGDNRFDSTSDPVGNSLVTGGPPRLQEYTWGASSGIRGDTYTGGSYRLTQDLGFLNSNSTFILPNNQGSARMAASVTQPLLRNRKIDQNRSLILTTKFETDAARAQFHDALQRQLKEVADVYWSLYLERADYVLRVRHLGRAEEITRELEDRATFDAVRSQVIRAQAAVAVRRADLARADANMKNFESRLRALLNAPGLSDQPFAELLTSQAPWVEKIRFDMASEMRVAIERRPEIQQLLSQIQVAGVRVRLADNQTQPKLDLVLEGYVAGLRGDSDVFGAVEDQFSQGRPGYAGGLEFELPYRNRAAHARQTRGRLEIAQLENQLRATQASVQSEVENAIRNVEANFLASESRKQSLRAVIAEVAYLEDRWRSLRGDAQFGQLQLDDLLNAQVRLLEEEQALLSSMVDYNLAIVEVQRGTGALVRFAQ